MHLAIIGYGNIAQSIIEWLGTKPAAHLTVLVRSTSLTQALKDEALAQAGASVTITDDITTLIEATPDLVVECAGQTAVAEFGPPVLAAGLDMVIVSTGALADEALFDTLERATQSGRSRVILPPGAIGGIDLLSALTLAGEVTVTYRGTKPPDAWRGTPAEDCCDLAALTAPCVFFSGSAREAAQTYPKNANVAATLALAGAGFDGTRVELIADPAAPGNAHAYEVDSPVGRFAMQIDNAASSGNAKTSMATAFSVIREIDQIRDSLGS
ncbi:aspartate dehydrogenase [uncultured Roseobacter sp.]|uniref:aspartate dehydrogenase n=1 Tax=uncultured Roseobacter sp. TaxID=114847 RepID=UPI00262A554D|nr:aspartate dehydrogenase [uncultured Roseobacter sp.]